MKTYAAAALALLFLSACSRQANQTAGPATPASAASAPAPKVEAASYPLTGEIRSVDLAGKILRVKHDAIPGYMPAMTMDFIVSAGDAAMAKPGQRIRAEMIPSKDGDFRLEKIWPDDKAAADTIATSARVLREDTHTRGKNAYREVGETVPDFALYDQEGKVVQSARFRGKQIMMNFIFTRCPVATMCPMATTKMTATQALAREGGVANIEFVSITLDPTFDTPGVLKEYAAARGIDTANFSFLTGPDKAIKDLLVQFGVIAELEGDLLKHTLTTLLIDEKGTISHRADGSQWEPKDFVAKMRK
ncbi:MAG TPA: SCO family protein [Opitutaceae bacterium]|nr:SCO family protein [Opitutaceae bacterium]